MFFSYCPVQQYMDITKLQLFWLTVPFIHSPRVCEQCCSVSIPTEQTTSFLRSLRPTVGALAMRFAFDRNALLGFTMR
jgi:hypothetical protein